MYLAAGDAQIKTKHYHLHYTEMFVHKARLQLLYSLLQEV